MQSFIVLAFLVSELAGGRCQNEGSLTLQKHLSPLRVNNEKLKIINYRIQSGIQGTQ